MPGVGDGTVVRTFDAPEAMGINFHEVRARSALNHVPGGRYGFGYTINPYRGCTHACVFCFARRTHTFLDFDAGRDFEREIVVKVNVPEVLRAELARPSWKRDLVALGTNTDPYQWVESRYRMMPEILAALEEADTPVSVLTKSPLVMRDVEIFERMAKRLPVSVNLSVPTLDEKAWRATEPHTPSPSARLDAVAELRRRGIDSGVLIAPLMPGINDTPEQVQPIVDRAKEAGATFLGGVALHLRDEVRDVFFAWLQAKRPDLIPRYETALSQRSRLHASQLRDTHPRQAESSAVGGRARRLEGRSIAEDAAQLADASEVRPPLRASDLLADPRGGPAAIPCPLKTHSSPVFESTLPRVLVVPEPMEPRPVPDPPRGGMVVPDLDHQLRPQRHPLEVAAAGPAARLGGAALARLQRRQHRAHARVSPGR